MRAPAADGGVLRFRPVSAILVLPRTAVRAALVALCLCLFFVGAAAAADTGSISGAVFDRTGTPIPQVTIKVAGAGLPIGRTVITDSNGVYRVEYLTPGRYQIDATKAGEGDARTTVVVSVGRDTQADLLLGLAVSEEVSVSATAPTVDVRSTEVSFNVSAETLNSLPLDRTYRGLFQLIPGVADNRSSIGPAAGGTRQSNTYLIDGANITNPSFGYLGTEINELDIVEVNLKRAGINAEFGRTAGSVTNAVSRSGTNQFVGLARIDWLSSDLVNAYKLPGDLLNAGVKPGTFRDPVLTTELQPAVGVGGPIVRDHVFFYGSARYFKEVKWERVNKAGTAMPDESRSGRELFGKISATPNPRHQLTASYRHRPNTVENAGINSDYAPSVALTSDNGSGVATAEWTTFFSPTRTLDVRYLYSKETNEDVPVNDLGLLPTFNPAQLAAMGQYSDPAQANLIVGGNQYSNTQNYRRNEIRATFSQSLDLARTSHTIKAGFGFERGEEEFNRLANGWGQIVNVTQGTIPALRARYYTPQAAQIGIGDTHSIFVQDEIVTTSRVSATAGVLFNRDQFSQDVDGSHGCPAALALSGGAAIFASHGDRCDFLRFGFGDEIQPRLGVSFQPRPKAGDKTYVNWGRYYGLDQKSSGRSLAPNRIFQTQTIFDLNGTVLSSAPLASTTGKLIDPDIEPTYTDEIVVGYATPFANDYSVDVFFMSRSLYNVIEDLPSRLSGTSQTSGPYVAANLPCDRFDACRNAEAKRTYRAATIDVRRRLTRGLATDVSYTWSRFEGNFDLDYSTAAAVFNTSSFIQDGPGAYVEDPNRFGPLFEDRPHVLKVFASYAATSRLMTSAYFRVQSGAPWAARGRDAAGAVLNYLEPAGSHRNPAWSNLDLMSSYRLPLSARADLTFEARLLNVFNNQTRLSTDAQKYLDLTTTSTPPYIAPYAQPNPFFGTGNSFAPPRRLYFAVSAGF